MSTRPQLWLLAGGNGAGKSTFYQQFLAHSGLPFVNADIIARKLFPDSSADHSYDAAKIAAKLRTDLLLEGRIFCFETVFSHPSKIDFVGHAKALGYEIILVFIHLESVNLNKARVSQRVELGGHNVPEDKIESRIPRLLNNIKTTILLCDQVRLLNNSRVDNPFVQVATIRQGAVEIHGDSLPDWAVFLIEP